MSKPAFAKVGRRTQPRFARLRGGPRRTPDRLDHHQYGPDRERPLRGAPHPVFARPLTAVTCPRCVRNGADRCGSHPESGRAHCARRNPAVAMSAQTGNKREPTSTCHLDRRHFPGLGPAAKAPPAGTPLPIRACMVECLRQQRSVLRGVKHEKSEFGPGCIGGRGFHARLRCRGADYCALHQEQHQSVLPGDSRRQQCGGGGARGEGGALRADHSGQRRRTGKARRGCDPQHAGRHRVRPCRQR